MNRFVTMVSGHVPVDRRADVVREYEAAVAEGLPPAIEMTFLLEGAGEIAVVTVWRSREDVSQLRASGNEPFALSLLRKAGASPNVRIFDVVAQAAS